MKKLLLLLLLIPNLVMGETSEDSFHDKIIALLEDSKNYMTLVRTSNHGKPFSFFFIVAPSDIHQHIFWNKKKNSTLYLRAITLRYGDSPQLEYITANCKDKEIDKKCVAGPDCSSELLPELDPLTGKKIMVDNRPLLYRDWNKKMSEQDYADFCQVDYSAAIKYVGDEFDNYRKKGQ